MLEEDIVNTHSRNGSERLLVLNAALFCILPTLYLGGDSDLMSVVFIALGLLAPVNVYAYKRMWIDAPEHTWRNYLTALAPCFAGLAVAFVSFANPTLVGDTFGGKIYFHLVDAPKNVPVCSALSASETLFAEFCTMAAVALSLSVYFITDSRYMLRRILYIVSSAAAVIALLGIAAKFLMPVGSFIGKGGFAMFFESQQWAAFAFIWLAGALAGCMHANQNYTISRFARSLKFGFLVNVLVLYAGIFAAGSAAYAFAASVLCLTAFAYMGFDTYPTRSAIKRHCHVVLRHRIKIADNLHLLVPCVCYALFALCAVLAGVKPAAEFFGCRAESEAATAALPQQELDALRADACGLIKERPVFGWGSGSFGDVMTLKQGADLGDYRWTSPKSDLLKKLAENGFAGLALVLITPVCMAALWLYRRRFSVSGAVMAAGVVFICYFAVVNDPLSNLATYGSFWVLLMTWFAWDRAKIV